MTKVVKFLKTVLGPYRYKCYNCEGTGRYQPKPGDKAHPVMCGICFGRGYITINKK